MLGVDGAAATTTIGEHVGVDAMRALAAEWAELFARCPRATPFSHPAWLLAWARQLAGGTPFAITLRRGGRLCALAPLHLDGDGTLELAGAPVSDYRDALIVDDAAAGDPVGDDLPRLLLAAMLQRALGGRCELADLPAHSPLATAPSPPGWREDIAACAVCPIVTLPPGGGLADAASARLCEDLPRFHRRLARRGALAVHFAGADDGDAWIDRLIALHASRWQRRGSDGVLADARVQRFHRAVAPGFAAAGLLAVTALTLDDRPVAVIYGFRRAARFYYYLSGFDPELERLSIGSLAIAAAFERAVAAGARELDFLRGGEPYKYRWGARDRPTLRRRLQREAACAP